MKKLKLPVSNMLTTNLVDLLNPPKMKTEDGRTIIPLGTINVTEALNEIEQARENAALIIWFAIHIEQELESIIADYLFGPVINDQIPSRDFFCNHILNTDALGFAKKREVFLRIIEETKLLKGKEMDKVHKLLARLMRMRNAFAHGQISANSDNVVSVKFFSGKHQSISMIEKFWVDLENDFTTLDEFIKAVKKELLNRWFAKIQVPEKQ